MSSINRMTSMQFRDYLSVSLAKVHNIGAGGVSITNTFDRTLASRKRKLQTIEREFRSLGYFAP